MPYLIVFLVQYQMVYRVNSLSGGHSTLTGMVVIFAMLSLIPIFTSFLHIYDTVLRLNQIASGTINMAKMVGGFNDEVVDNFENLLSELEIDNEKIDVVFTPGINIISNKRDVLRVDIKYRDRLNIMGFDRSRIGIAVEIPISVKAYSHYYQKGRRY